MHCCLVKGSNPFGWNSRLNSLTMAGNRVLELASGGAAERQIVERDGPGVCSFGLLSVWNAVIVPDTMRDLSVHTGEVVVTGTETMLLPLIADGLYTSRLTYPLDCVGTDGTFNLMIGVIRGEDLYLTSPSSSCRSCQDPFWLPVLLTLMTQASMWPCLCWEDRVLKVSLSLVS